MKLTTKSEYSILALLHIARNQDEGFVKSENISRSCNIPHKYLEALLGILKQRGYLRTRRGASGGFCLGMPAEKISLADVIRLMDGALAPTESVSEYFFMHTPLEQENKVLDIFREIRDYIAQKLENISLANLL